MPDDLFVDGHRTIYLSSSYRRRVRPTVNDEMREPLLLEVAPCLFKVSHAYLFPSMCLSEHPITGTPDSALYNLPVRGCLVYPVAKLCVSIGVSTARDAVLSSALLSLPPLLHMPFRYDRHQPSLTPTCALLPYQSKLQRSSWQACGCNA